MHEESKAPEQHVVTRGDPSCNNDMNWSGATPRLLDGPPRFPPLFPGLSKEYLKSSLLYISHSDETERMFLIVQLNR